MKKVFKPISAVVIITVIAMFVVIPGTFVFSEKGDVIMQEDFNDGTADNWSVWEGTWSVSNYEYNQSVTSGRTGSYYTQGTSWTDYCFSADVEADGSGKPGLAFRVTDSMNDFYYIRIQDTTQLSFQKIVDGGFGSQIATFNYSTVAGNKYNLKVIADGNKFTFFVDNNEVGTASDSTHTSGSIGLYTHNDSVTFDNVLVTELAVYEETFNDGLADNWSVWAGTWSVSNQEYNQTVTSGRTGAYYSQGSYTDYVFSADVQADGSGKPGLAFRVNNSMANFYYMRIQDTTEITVQKIVNNGFGQEVETYSYPTTQGTKYNLKVKAEGSNYSFYVDDDLLGTAYDTTHTGGTIGLYTHDGSVSFDNVIVDEIPSSSPTPTTSPTPTPTPTPTQTSTPTPTPSPSPTPTSGALLDEDFDDGTADNFSVWDGTWSINNQAYRQTETSGRTGCYYTSGTSFTDYMFSADVKALDANAKAGIAFRVGSGMSNFYYMRFDDTSTISVQKIVDNGFGVSIASFDYSSTQGNVYKLSVKAIGSNFTFYVNDVKIGTASSTTHSSGSVGLYTHNGAVEFDNVYVTEESAGDSQLPDPPGTNYINLYDKGLRDGDNIKSYLETWVQNGNEVHIPAGTYNQTSGISISANNASIVGDGEVILQRPNGASGCDFQLLCSSGELELRNVTFKGKTQEKSALYPKGTTTDGTVTIRLVKIPDGGLENSTSVGIFVPIGHKGKVYIIDTHVYNSANNGIYASAPGKQSGGHGEVHVLRGLYKNNNIAGVRIGSSKSSIKNVVVVNDALAPSHPNGRNQRGIWVRSDGYNIEINNCDVTKTISSGIPIAINAESNNVGGGSVTNCRVRNDDANDDALRFNSGTWTADNIHITGTGSYTIDGVGSHVTVTNKYTGVNADAPRTTAYPPVE